MKPSQLLELHREALRILVAKQARLRNLRVFGSVASGKDTEASDIDFLIEPLDGASLYDLAGLHVELEELLGVKVDLVTPRGLPKRSRDRIISEALPV
ncbi:nucleotidyltransferase family protein [Ideonella azotifigens]|nr:nucleotidyltransferase family protein [Ideonella azotifigens]MCD2339189.1 nucleotidyltransferase family protein [Ideonella azotifigens]